MVLGRGGGGGVQRFWVSLGPKYTRRRKGTMEESLGLKMFQGVPAVSIVVPFLGLPYRILNI